ncbi:MAG: GMC family oxidoreductase N-terminal domain-containing protein, partial [Pseudomonadota bacterium]
MNVDYVIVGAGSAGCALANRLSEGGRHSVLLLEAGGDDRRFWIQVPIGYGRTFFDPTVNWMYETEPVPSTADRASYWPRGKVLGGSSAINAMVYIRGHRADFDDWRDAGNPGWAYADVLPIFRRLEDHFSGESAFHGSTGPLRVESPERDIHPLSHAYIQAAAEAGMQRNPDFNGADFEGVGVYHLTTKGGRRMSAARAYLKPARGRRNLSVRTHTFVTRLVFEGRRVTGVEFQADGRSQRVHAKGEVILCAGAINSPQLLMLSGIGPGQTLQNLGIDVVHHNPAVGHHLQDHYGIDHVYRANRPTLNDALYPWWGKFIAGATYALARRGPLALSLNQAGGFLRTRPELLQPNIQLYFWPLSYLRAPVGTRPLMSPDPYSGFSMGTSQCRPSSRGHLTLRSANANDAPEIHPNYLSTDYDVQTHLEGLRFLRTLSQTPTLRSIIEEEIEPGPAVASDEALIADLRERGTTVFHPCGTCRMSDDPAGAVVDANLRVHGIEGLRVADASVFPNLDSADFRPWIDEAEADRKGMGPDEFA